ncbi:cytochrome P450 [Nocardia sp. NPDC051052]|uniref:cytochrome P450 n=1 Tax=Nocardia sp. NPDC051052 TaxID=3364322 RepID=UPI00379F5E0D
MKIEVPRAPGAIPLLGHSVSLLNNPLEFLLSLPAHGDLVRMNLGPASVVVVCSPELTQQLLREDHVFDKGGPLFERGREAMGNGLGTCPHSMHRRQRRLIQPAFQRSRLADYAALMSDRIAALTDSWQDGQVLDMYAEMLKLSSAVTAATLFASTVPEGDLRRMTDDVTVIAEGALRRTLLPPPLDRAPIPGNRAFIRATTNMRRDVATIIDARRAAGTSHNDLLSALLATRGDIDGDGGLSDTEITDQILTFFLASTETTATVLAWALYILDRHPEIADRVRTEVDSVLGGRCARYDDLTRLGLTGRVITECLRLYSPAWFLTRVVNIDTELGGYALPAGTPIAYSPYLIHHREDLYPHPERFDPDRWDPAIATPPPRPAFIPFGDGARKCIGDIFALTETTLALATISGRWQLHTLTDREIRPRLGTVIHPRKLHMRLTSAGRLR